MANFSPFNNYMLYVFDKLIAQYRLKPPFLDAGCGIGYASRHLAMKGWGGKAIDLSGKAIKMSRENLSSFPEVEVKKESILNQKDKYNTIFLFDVLEHIKDDVKILKKINSLLAPGGYLVLALTSNPREWRWDDEFYGHYRRYSARDIETKLKSTGLKPQDFIEYTFPVFWLIRRIYTAVLIPPKVNYSDKEKRTKQSALSSAWRIPAFASLIVNLTPFWNMVFFLQYLLFKKSTSWGFAMFVLAKKSE